MENGVAASTAHKNSFATNLIFTLLLFDAFFKWIYYGLYYPLVSPNSDYSKHWDAAHALLNGTTPFFEPCPLGYAYPLFASIPYLWLGLFSIEKARVLWIICNFFHVTMGTFLLAYFLKPKQFYEYAGEPDAAMRFRRGLGRNWGLIIVILMANYKPLVSTLLPANIEPFNYLFFCVFTVALLKNKPVATALSWVCFSLIKLVPVILIMPMFLTKKIKEVVIYLSVLIGYAALLVVTGYWRIEAVLFKEWLPRLAHFYESINYSTHRTLALYFNPEAMLSYQSYNKWALSINVVLGFLITLICLAWAKRGKGSSELLIGFVMLCMPLLSPILEYIHFVWGVPLLIFQLLAWYEGRISHKNGLILFLGWLGILLVHHLSNHISGGLPFFGSWLFLSSPVGFVLAGLSAWTAFHAKGRDELPASVSLS